MKNDEKRLKDQALSHSFEPCPCDFPRLLGQHQLRLVPLALPVGRLVGGDGHVAGAQPVEELIEMLRVLAPLLAGREELL